MSQFFKPYLRFPVIIFCVITLFVVSIATPSNPARAVGCSPYHIVNPGENLFRIGLKYGVSWVVLAQMNGIANPNRILVGQVVCLPTGAVVVTPPIVVPTAVPGTVPSGSVYYPPAGVYPFIQFDRTSAAIGETIQISGFRFPGNAVADIYITNKGFAYPATASASVNVGADGNFVVNFVVPPAVDTLPLNGAQLSVKVIARVTGFYGYNFFTRR